MDTRFHFIARVKLTLANGDVVTEFMSDCICATSLENAEAQAESAIREMAFDLDCNKVDAPVEDVEILSRTWV